jgi:hypothetical protein
MDIKIDKQVRAVGFYVAEKMEHGESFNHELCIEDIHRMYGLDIARWMEAKMEANKQTNK